MPVSGLRNRAFGAWIEGNIITSLSALCKSEDMTCRLVRAHEGAAADALFVRDITHADPPFPQNGDDIEEYEWAMRAKNAPSFLIDCKAGLFRPRSMISLYLVAFHPTKVYVIPHHQSNLHHISFKHNQETLLQLQPYQWEKNTWSYLLRSMANSDFLDTYNGVRTHWTPLLCRLPSDIHDFEEKKMLAADSIQKILNATLPYQKPLGIRLDLPRYQPFGADITITILPRSTKSLAPSKLNIEFKYSAVNKIHGGIRSALTKNSPDWHFLIWHSLSTLYLFSRGKVTKNLRRIQCPELEELNDAQVGTLLDTLEPLRLYLESQTTSQIGKAVVKFFLENHDDAIEGVQAAIDRRREIVPTVAVSRTNRGLQPVVQNPPFGKSWCVEYNRLAEASGRTTRAVWFGSDHPLAEAIVIHFKAVPAGSLAYWISKLNLQELERTKCVLLRFGADSIDGDGSSIKHKGFVLERTSLSLPLTNQAFFYVASRSPDLHRRMLFLPSTLVLWPRGTEHQQWKINDMDSRKAPGIGKTSAIKLNHYTPSIKPKCCDLPLWQTLPSIQVAVEGFFIKEPYEDTRLWDSMATIYLDSYVVSLLQFMKAPTVYGRISRQEEGGICDHTVAKCLLYGIRILDDQTGARKSQAQLEKLVQEYKNKNIPPPSAEEKAKAGLSGLRRGPLSAVYKSWVPSGRASTCKAQASELARIDGLVEQVLGCNSTQKKRQSMGEEEALKVFGKPGG